MDGVFCAIGAGSGARSDKQCDEELENRAIRRVLLAGLQRWCLDVSAWGDLSSHQWDVLLELLPEDERSRVKNFRRENDQRLALGSRLLQRAVVSKVFGLKSSDVTIRRTSERKPYFVGVAEAIRRGTVSPLLKNWNFNVSHHGKFVAIASEPVCLCGVDIVDTERRSNERGPADDYFRYFTQHFTDSEWGAIKRGVNDESKLRRFYLNWGLKEAYVKAVGQGLGYDLRRVSFVEGDWLDCSSSVKDFADASGRRTCRCPRKALKSFDMASNRELRHGVPCDFKSESEEYRAESGDHEEVLEALLWKQEDVVGCTCGLGTAAVKVDGIPRPDWSFQVFTLPDRYAACVARGPPSECSSVGQAAGVISDPNVGGDTYRQGQTLPQLRFREVKLADIIPPEAAQKMDDLRTL
ncbi:unnamed protein product [Ascophyllum nodosum]